MLLVAAVREYVRRFDASTTMSGNELIWRIAGGSGDGIDSTSQNFTKALLRAGLHVFTHRHYPSRILGGHTFVALRTRDQPAHPPDDGYNVLLSLRVPLPHNPLDYSLSSNAQYNPRTL